MQDNARKEVPLVSIVMSAFNEEKYIAESINSILNQTYSNIEVIIIDDASTDKTVEKIGQIRDDRIKLYVNDKNRKLAHNLNFAIGKAKGKYIARMDADDIALPNRIEEQVNFMEQNLNVDILGAFAVCFGDSSAKMEYPVSHDAIKVSLLFENALCHPLVMFRRESLDERYNESYAASQDYELWSRVIWKKHFYNMNSVLLKYRVHKNQTKNVVGRKQKEGAIAARHEMLKHLVDDADPVFLATFDKMFLVGNRYDQTTINEIEVTLKKIIGLNMDRKVFKHELLCRKCEQIYFENWYYSVIPGIQKIKYINQKSILKNYYRKLNFDKKIKVLLRCFLYNS